MSLDLDIVVAPDHAERLEAALADISRLIEAYPELRSRVPDELLDKLP